MVAVVGMKMPKNCMECLLFDDEYGDCNVYGESKADMTEERAGNCPLVEIVTCRNCKHWKDSDGVYRRGVDAESKCPVNTKAVFEGNSYCALGERKE